MAEPTLRVCWSDAEGDEHEERWPSLAAFLAWAEGEGLVCRWSAYRDDADGEGELIARGVTGGGRAHERR